MAPILGLRECPDVRWKRDDRVGTVARDPNDRQDLLPLPEANSVNRLRRVWFADPLPSLSMQELQGILAINSCTARRAGSDDTGAFRPAWQARESGMSPSAGSASRAAIRTLPSALRVIPENPDWARC